MRRRVMMVQSAGKNRDDIVAGDILCAKADSSKMVFDAADYSDISSSSWTPIGVVVIPPSHDVYGTGEGVAVSLKYMSYNTPDEGTTSEQKIQLGQYGADTEIAKFNAFYVTDNTSTPTISVGAAYSSVRLPSDNFTKVQCTLDPVAYYNSNSNPAPSPYLSDGSRYEGYYTTEYSEYNAFSDFDGFGNTNILCDVATAQSDWKTASTITNGNYGSYSPAACCCWRYHTTGTNQGDWYLPAMGELGYLMVRLKTINTSISNIGYTTISTDSKLWSSSEIDWSDCCYLNTAAGIPSWNNKDQNSLVRSFIRF